MPLPTAKTPPRSELQHLSALLYGGPKIGKSTMCSQIPGALFLATEPGLNHIEAFQVPVASWTEFLLHCTEIAAGKHDFKCVVIDTIDQAHRLCREFVLAREGIKHESEQGYGKGYNAVAEEFMRVLRKMSLLPYGLWLVSHAVEKEIDTRTGKLVRVVPTLPDRVRRDVTALCDLVLYADVEANDDGTATRVIRTKPSRTYDAGDRTGKLPETMPLDFAAITAAMKGQKT